MDAKFILYAFLIQGMVFSYVWTGYYVGGGQIFSYHYNMTYTWVNEGIRVKIVGNATMQYEGAPIKPQVYPFSSKGLEPTYYQLFYEGKNGPEEFILYFTNFTTTTVNLEGVTIPAIKFYKGDSYLIVSAQYGFPIEGYAQNYLPYSSATESDNISLKLTKVSPLPSFVSSERLYEVVLNLRQTETKTFPKVVYVIAPSAKITAKQLNTTVIDVEAKGYATLIFPLDEFPLVEPIGEMIINGKYYYFYPNQTTNYFGTYYVAIPENESNPYMAVTIGKYFVIFVPNGGNVSVFLANGENPLVSYKVIDEDSLKYQIMSNIYYIIPAIAVIAVIVTVVLLRRRGS